MAAKFDYPRLGTLGLAKVMLELLRQYQNRNSSPTKTNEGPRRL